MKIKLVRITKIICFCIIVILMIGALTDLLKPKWLENRWMSSKTNKSFYELEENSNEVIFFGASVISAAIDPFQLYDEQGIASYNLGGMSQPMIATYYWFKESLNTQNIKLAVVEIKSAGRSSEKAEEKARKSYDYMKWGRNKIEYALGYKNFHKEADETDKEVNLWSYFFPLYLYHTRWSELTYDDYDFFLGNDNSYTKGFSALSTRFKDSTSYEAEEDLKGRYDGFDADTDKKEEPNPINAEYMDKLIKLAKEKGVELLFVKTPDTKWNVEQHNYIQSVADENNIKFLDLNLKSYREKMNFNYVEDAADTVHVNLSGARKISRFIGQYISDNYELTDYREGKNNIKKEHELQKANYQAVIKNAELSMITNLDEYLKAINDEEYAVFIVSGSNVGDIAFTSEQKKIMLNMGVQETAFEQSDYGTNIICVIDGGKTVNNIKKQNSKFSKSSTEGGKLDVGTDYSITADAKGSALRLNDNEYKSLKSNAFNIIVYDKKLKEVSDSVYLYTGHNVTAVYRGE